MNNNALSIYFKIVVLTATIMAILSISPVSSAQRTTEAEWQTTEQRPKSLSLKIESIIHNGVNRALNPGEILIITMEGTPGVQASFLLINDKNTVREISAQEIAPGTYQSKILVSVKERVVEGAVMGRLQQGRQVIYRAASQAFTYHRNIARTPQVIKPSLPSTEVDQNVFPPQASGMEINKHLHLKFTSHQNREAIDTNGFVLKGQTQPHADVKITITSKLPLIGELIELKGDTLIQQTVKANSQGIFQLAIPPTHTAPSGLKYTIDAVAILNNQTSEPTQLTLVQP